MSNTIERRPDIKPRVLYVHYGDNWIRGSEIVLLDLLKSAKENNYHPILWCNSKVLRSRALELGIEVIIDNFVCLGYWTLPRWNFRQFFRLLIKAKKIIKEYKIALVHCNNGAPCQWMVPICKFSGTPILLHLHARYMYRDRLTLLFHGVDHIIGVSQSVIKLFKQDEFRNQSVGVIYNGVEPKRVLCNNPCDIRAELSAKQNDFVILYIGSLIARKSVHNLLYALKQLKDAYEVKLAIVGSGSEETALISMVNQLNLNANVKFFSDTDKVAKYYSSKADCFISVPTEEVFGLTLAEASLAKLPIITSNISGINEIYTDQENALLVPANNTLELVNAIKSLIETPSLRMTLAKNAQKHIVEAFSLEQQFVDFNLAYQNLMQRESNLNTTQVIISHVKTVVMALLNKACKYITLKLSWGKSHE